MLVTREQASAVLGETVTIFEKYAPIITIGLTKDGEGYALKVNFLEVPNAPLQERMYVRGVPIRWVVTGEVVAHYDRLH